MDEIKELARRVEGGIHAARIVSYCLAEDSDAYAQDALFYLTDALTEAVVNLTGKLDRLK